MKTVNAFQTSDGVLFESKSLADKHEMTISKLSLIADFLGSEFNKYPARNQSVIAKNSIIGWELWKVKNDLLK
jgi:hypothetical protein